MKAVAVIVNFFFPGIGSLILGQVGVGIAQFLIYMVGAILTLTAILAIIGIPMMIAAWIWGLVSAATTPVAPVVVNVVQAQPGEERK